MDPQTIEKFEGRRMAYGKVSHAFSQPIIGTDPKAMKIFNVEQAGPRAFRLIPDTELGPGKYCFFFNRPAFVAKGDVTFWDFGID
jgi:hypothetical protein